MYIKSRQNLNLEYVCKFMTLMYFCALYALNAERVYIELIYIFVLVIYCISNKIKFSKYLLWSVCFLGICILSNLWTMTPIDTLYSTRGVLEIVIIANLLISFINTEAKIEFILKCFVIAGVALIVRLIIKVPFNAYGVKRIGDDLYNANSIGLQLSVSAICAVYFVLTRKRKNGIYYFLILNFFVVIILTGSRKAFLFSTLGCIMMYLINVKRKSKLIFIIPATGLLVYILFSYMMTIPQFYQILGIRIEALLNLITGTGETDGSVRERMFLINTGVDLWKSKPWIGYGLQSFATISGSGLYAHNNYIELLVGVGLIGTSIYYSLYVFLLIKLGKIVFDGIKIAAPFFVIIVLLIINEYGFVSYGEETFQIILAVGVSCAQIMSKWECKTKRN